MLCLNPALAQRDNWDWRPLEKEGIKRSIPTTLTDKRLIMR